MYAIRSYYVHNADIGVEILDAVIEKKGILDLSTGARKLARRLSGQIDQSIKDRIVSVSFARNGWMVPNQYWTPGALSPMAIMGKYFMYYGEDFIPPRELGKKDAERFKGELILDNMGMCRFHRKWAEEMLPEVIDSLFGMKDLFRNNFV